MHLIWMQVRNWPLAKKACVDHCDEIIVHIPYSECTKKPPPNIGMLRLYKMSE